MSHIMCRVYRGSIILNTSLQLPIILTAAGIKRRPLAWAYASRKFVTSHGMLVQEACLVRLMGSAEPNVRGNIGNAKIAAGSA